MTSEADSALTVAQQERLLRFLGYGNPHADFVFVGMEEGLTETPDYPLLAQLRERAALASIVDLRECGIHPGKYLSGERPPIQRTWGTLIAVLLAVIGERNDNESVRRYQRDRLGRADGESLLLELMPLPARNIQNWSPYNLYFKDYSTRELYLEHLREKRIAAIRQAIQYGPKLVLLYGSGYWKHYREIFPEIVSWQQQDLFSYARTESTGVILMPHPVARQMNGRRSALCELACRLAVC